MTSGRTQRVPGVPNRLYQTRLAGAFELLAQSLHGHVDDVGVPQIVETPHPFKNQSARQDALRMLKEEHQQRILQRPEVNLTLTSHDFPGCCLDAEVAEM